MPRVKLESQPKYEFEFETTIQEVDLNYAGHLGNDALLRMLQAARIELFQSLGYKELDLGDGKTGIIIGDLVVNYKAEGFRSEVVKIESHIGELTKKSLRIFHKIVKIADNKLVALAETGLIAFNYETREISEFPNDFETELKKINRQ